LIMKKLVFLFIIVLMAGCGRQHVYHTYYGDIDIDTMEVAFYDIKDSLPCYLIRTLEYDSVEIVPGEWGIIKGPVELFYCPDKITYYYSFPDNQGNRILNAYNYITKEFYNPETK